MSQPHFWHLDAQYALWHPCTQMKDHETYPLLPIQRGSGIWLEDVHGHRYMDAISSWWVNLFGHCHPDINAALQDQLQTLEHVILAGCTHEAAVTLANRLVNIAPKGLTRCFFADNGASAVEIALKMSFHSWINLGQPQKKRFVTLEGGYHGETLGALSVTHVPQFRKAYGPLLFDVISVTSPDAYLRLEGESSEEYALRALVEVETLFAQKHTEIAAFILEPLVQCSTGMRMYHPIYLTKLRALCDHYQIHLIADEIAVGFGRTGTMFACEQANITPDLMCLSKALTGGYLPLSCVLASEAIYQSFYADHPSQKAFLHSHSYTGNALACRAALATLNLFEKYQTLQNNQRLIQRLADKLAPFHDHPHISDVRQCGMIAAWECVADKNTQQPYPAHERRGLKMHLQALKKGVLIRPLGDTVYIIPPYIITEEQIDWLLSNIWDIISEVSTHR